VFDNQIARFSERTAHLVFLIVRKGSLNREKSQSKIDQDFGRNRKMAEKGGGIVIFAIYNLSFLEVSNGNIVKRSYSDTLRELRRKLNTTKGT
ncbi:hypothetical protein DWU89_19040, partial [Parabacteroides acidifaciens]